MKDMPARRALVGRIVDLRSHPGPIFIRIPLRRLCGRWIWDLGLLNPIGGFHLDFEDVNAQCAWSQASFGSSICL